MAGIFDPPPDVEVFETSTLILWIDDGGIMRIVCKPGAAHGAEEADENNAVIPTRRGPVLADIRSIAAVNREARQRYRTQASETTALALVVKSPLSRVIGNFFVGLSRLSFPVRLFTDEVEALRWLKQ